MPTLIRSRLFRDKPPHGTPLRVGGGPIDAPTPDWCFLLGEGWGGLTQMLPHGASAAFTYGSGYPKWAGHAGIGIDFSAGAGLVSVPYRKGLSIAAPMTIMFEAAIRGQGGSSLGRFMQLTDGTNGWVLYLNGGKLTFQPLPSGTNVTGATSLPTTMKRFVGAATYDTAQNTKIFLNGVQDASGSGGAMGSPSSPTLYLSNSNAGTRNMDGVLYWAYGWNRILTPAQIYSFYENPFQVFAQSPWLWTPTPGGTAWTKSLTETLSLTDARTMGAMKALSETLSLTDARAMAFGKALAETLSLSDLRAGGANKLLAEALSLTDVRAAGAAKALGDTLAFSDTVSRLLNPSGTAWTQTLYEVLSLTDSLAVALGSLLVIVTEAAGIDPISQSAAADTGGRSGGGGDAVSRSYIEDVVARVSAQDIIRRSGGRA